MSDATQDGGPGLIRSIVHRLAGEEVALGVEGRHASFEGATAWLNSDRLTPEDLRETTREALVRTAGERFSWDGVARGVIAAARGEHDALPEP